MTPRPRVVASATVLGIAMREGWIETARGGSFVVNLDKCKASLSRAVVQEFGREDLAYGAREMIGAARGDVDEADEEAMHHVFGLAYDKLLEELA